MQQYGVEPARPLAASGFAHDHGTRNVACLLILRAERYRNWLNRRPRRFECAFKLRHQRREATATYRHRFNNGYTQCAGELFCIQLQAITLGKIDHVQRDHRRQALRNQLERKAQMVIEIAGIQHNDKRVRTAMALQISQHHIAGNGFIKAIGIEAIRTRQVDHLHGLAVVKRRPPRFALNRYAGIIRNLLPCAGQRIEQRTFAGIGVPDKGNEGRHLRHGLSSQSMAAATLLRKATVIRPTRTASGSRHIKMPLCIASMVTPGSKPRERRRCPS